MDRTIRLVDPVNVLARGYSITISRGKVIRSASQIAAGEELVTILKDGRIISITKSLTINEDYDPNA